jgi:hypothetical protein
MNHRIPEQSGQRNDSDIALCIKLYTSSLTLHVTDYYILNVESHHYFVSAEVL